MTTTTLPAPEAASPANGPAANELDRRMHAARDLLLRHWGFPDFRPAQRRVVRSVLAGRDVLAILPTGGGKSLCFQVPALVLDGLTIVVSPLLALMQDQVNALVARGVGAGAMTSLLKPAAQQELLTRVKTGEVKLLYVSPERLERLASDLAALDIRPTLLAIDEAHCVAEWGHDFRPAYRKLGRLRWKLGRPPVVALSGSATPEVREDIARTLRLGAWGATKGRWDLHLGSFDRPNLWFGVVSVRNEHQRWERLLDLLKVEDRTALVYVPTRGLAEGIARGLVQRGFHAAPFHAGLPPAVRKETLRRFLDDELEIVVATCAFGMGIDKPTVRLVVHWTLPPTPESYYQEAGRAGRDGRFARCVLLHHPADEALHRRQLDVTFPPRELCEKAWGSRKEEEKLPASVRASVERLRRELRPERGGVDWRPIAARRARAEARLGAIVGYAQGANCFRAGLVQYFGERIATCAGCGRCASGAVPLPLDPAARARFRALRRALAPARTPWGGALIEPPVLARLAESPPPDAASLAAVAGVGAELTMRMGGTILEALGVTPRPPAPPEPTSELHALLLAWRRARALAEGAEPWQVIEERALLAIAAECPSDLPTLARVGGLGPRTLAAYGEELLRLVAGERERTGGTEDPVTRDGADPV
jgi:ATP-dependent DNA helicase RecQ